MLALSDPGARPTARLTTHLPSMDVLHDLLLPRERSLLSPVGVAVCLCHQQGHQVDTGPGPLSPQLPGIDRPFKSAAARDFVSLCQAPTLISHKRRLTSAPGYPARPSRSRTRRWPTHRQRLRYHPVPSLASCACNGSARSLPWAGDLCEEGKASGGRRWR